LKRLRELLRQSPIYVGFLSQLMQYGFGLLILPVALSRLEPTVIGLWYIFVAAQSLVGLMDFGFTQTFSRNFSYVLAGARELRREGVEAASGDGVDHALFASLLVTAKRIYRTIALITFAVLGSVGSWYVGRVARDGGLPTSDVWIAWVVFAISLTMNVYYQWQSALLIGADRVQQNYRINIASRAAQLVLSIVGLIIHPTLIVLVLGYAASVAVTRAYGYVSVRDLTDKSSSASDERARALFPVLWHNASRLGLVSLGAFLITRFSTFAVGYFLGLSVAARFAIAMQALGVIQALSQVAFSINMPRIAGARVEGNRDLLRHLTLKSLAFSWFIFISASTALVVLGPALLRLMHSRTTLPATSVLVLMGIVWLLESNHTNCALVIVTGNTVPFVPAALLSGLAIAAGTTLAGRLGGGLTAFILVQGFVQAAYNNWRWPLLVFRELDLGRSTLGWRYRESAAR
jgi:O-antigen/teichoic acid export membrane protein